MEIKAIKDYLYKHDGEFSVLYENIKEINNDFDVLLNVKKQKSKEDLKRNALSQLKDEDKRLGEVLIDRIVELVFKDIKECHKQIYG